MKVLVTGADGFVGRHLCASLRARGDVVVEATGPAGATPLDVTDAAAVRDRVEAAQADAIVHLAGVSSVAGSHQQPPRTYEVNVGGAVNLLTAVREAAPRTRVLLVGSGEVYGPVAPGLRAFEEYPLVPTSPYAASKIGAEMAGQQFFRSYRTDVVCVRPFNHLGAGQAAGFAVPSFAAQLQAIRRGEGEPVLRVGNLEPVRDFSHVLDVVDAYRLLLERGSAGAVYNVCSGQPRTIRSLIDEMAALLEIAVKVEVDPGRLRPSDIPYLVGDSTRIDRLGWRRTRTVRQALAEVLEEHSAARQPSASAAR